MPPMIALILCSIFVAFLLKLDYQRFETPEIIASWVPTLWLLRCTSKPIGYWFGKQHTISDSLADAVAAGSPMDRVFLLTLVLFGLIILVRREIDWRDIVKDNKWLFILYIFMLLSILWSDYQYVSFKRWIKASGIIVMVLLVLTGQSPKEELESILSRIVYITIPFSVLLVKYFPQLGVNWGRWSGLPSWAGFTMGKNQLGALCMISLFFLIWTWAKKGEQTKILFSGYETIAHIMLFSMALWLLIGPGAFSATSTMVLIIGLVILFLLRWQKINLHIVAIACLCIFIIGVAYPFIWESLSKSVPIIFITTLLGRDPTLTSRGNMIWDKLTPVAIENSVIGKGYGGFWIEYLIFDKHYINEAHNGYLDLLIQLGVVGLIIFTIVMLTFYKRSISVLRVDKEWGSFLLAYLLMTLIHNITESSYLVPNLLIWNLLVMLFLAFPENEENEENEERILT